MSTDTLGPLGPVRCQHRWTPGPDLPYPQTPDSGDMKEFLIETAWCKRCCGARLRLKSTEREHVVSSWDYADSMTDILLGRPLEEHETQRVAKSVALN